MKSILAIIAFCISTSAFAEQPSNQVWVFVGDPDAAMAGHSGCGPCNRLCQDLQMYKTTEGNPIIGHGKESLFMLIKAAPGTVIPRIQFPGENQTPGYSGEHKTLIQKHPDAGRIKASSPVRKEVQSTPAWSDEPNIPIRIRPAIAERR